MKKFEVLDSYMEKNQKPQSDTDSGDSAKDKGKEKVDSSGEETVSCFKTEDEMEEFFKRTSAFTVEGALNGNAVLYSDIDNIPEIELINMLDFEDVNSYDDDSYLIIRRRRKGKRGPGAKREPPKPKYLSCEVTGPNGFKYVVKKKIRYVDPSLPVYQRVPRPLPLSWAKRIKPLQVEKRVNGCTRIKVDKVVNANLAELGPFQGILMNPSTVSEIAGLDLSDEVIPQGLAFVWAEKEEIAELFSIMSEYGFEYVENFCWVKQAANNKRLRTSSAFFRKSKLSMLIFRKRNTGSPDTLELRHQRNPDVVWDCVTYSPEGMPSRPEFLYDVIETLLPAANYDESKKRGELLDLWSPLHTRRSGWTHVSEH